MCVVCIAFCMKFKRTFLKSLKTIAMSLQVHNFLNPIMTCYEPDHIVLRKVVRQALTTRGWMSSAEEKYDQSLVLESSSYLLSLQGISQVAGFQCI